MQQPNHGGHPHRRKVVLFQDDATNNSVGAQSELDLDLYETDEVPDSPGQQLPGISLNGMPRYSTVARSSRHLRHPCTRVVRHPSPTRSRATCRRSTTHTRTRRARPVGPVTRAACTGIAP
jgi:hypothetical protein